MNKVFKVSVFSLCVFFSLCLVVNADAVASNFCKDFSNTLSLVGFFILVIRIIVPLAIIVMGSFDFYNSLISGKENDLKKGLITLGKRVLMGILIFFVPLLIDLIVLSTDSSSNSDYKVCVDCLVKPSSCK